MSPKNLPAYGGQAVLEGVMMRGKLVAATAVRAPDHQIVRRVDPLNPVYRGRLAQTPFLRGLLGLWDALGLGWKSLSYSAEVALGSEGKLEGPSAWITVLIAGTIAVGLFMLTPAAVARWLEVTWPQSVNVWVSNVIEGLIRLGLLLAYLWAVGFMPDIRRVFAYHGAEHKVINAFEAGAELTPAVVAGFPRQHVRCGTAFLLTVVILSVVLFALLGPLPLGLRLLSRVLLIPVLAGLAYEYLRFTARNIDNPVVRVLVQPGLALQGLTTREPDAEMLEVALAALLALREKEDLAP
jgi:uncharacterized protein YqhQ